MSGRRDFLSMPAPENYVAGLGRGATGFTTRSDLGPAREGPSEDQMKEMLAKRAASLGQAAPSAYGVTEKKEEEKDEEEDRFQDPDNEVGLFSSGMNYDKEDDEADRIYQEVDEKMDKRRRARREAREEQERKEHEAANPKIQLLFADLKRNLSSVSEEEWAALPDSGDNTHRAKRAREARLANNRSYAVPDSVLQAASKQGELDTTISANDADSGTMTNFQSIGQAQQSALQVRLDTAANTPSSTDAASGVSTVDPRGYITALDKKQASGAEIPVEDIARARLLLESQVRTNVHNGPGYVALSRLEEVASRINVAKSVIAKGCQMCPKSQACWVENLRLNADNIHNAKVIAAKALSFLPKSTELWLAARDLEDTPGARKKVLRKALDFNATSVEMWKALINETEDIESVRMLFAKSIETIPLAEDLWLAYAAVCDAEASQQVLNRARKAVPSSWKIWIAACRLSEATGSLDRLDAIMSRAVKALIKENSMISREEWLAQAEICEEEGSPASAAALVKATIGWALDEDDDRRDIWLEDAKAVRNRTHYETARAIHRVTLAHFPQSTTAWTVAIDLEKHHGTIESLLDRYSASVNACANSETLWIDYVKTMWNVDREEARKLLGRSFEQLPGNERCFLTAVSLEMDEENYDRAREFLQLARSTSPTDRIFIKSVVLEFQTGNYEAAIDLCNLGLQSFGSSFKLFALKGQLYEQLSRLKEAENAYSAGTRAAPRSPVLFILLSRLQEKQGALVRARSTLDRGRQQNPQNDDLWLESIKLEKRANNVNTAKTMMATALRECARSGKLHAWNIMELESRTQRKPRALEAIKRVENDPVLYVCIARIFEAERKLDKASNWFLKAVVLDSLQGDSWIYYMKFLERYGTEEKKAEVLSKAILAEPRYGEIWQPVNKDPKNARLGIEEKLKIAVARLD